MSAEHKACPMCEASLLRMQGLWFCGECGFRLGFAEPYVSHEEVAAATRHYLAAGGVVTRLPDEPQPEFQPVGLNEETLTDLRPLPWDEVVLPGSNWTVAPVVAEGPSFTSASSGSPLTGFQVWDIAG